MRASVRLLQSCRITLFTRSNCSLCTDAKHILAAVWDKRPFVFDEVDVMKADQRGWRDLYEFDTPVIHIGRAEDGVERKELAGKAVKLMHRFTADEVHERMSQVEWGKK